MNCRHPNMRKANFAVADRRGLTQMRGDATYLGRLRMIDGSGNVNVTTIDDIFGTSKAGFLHIDVEGHE